MLGKKAIAGILAATILAAPQLPAVQNAAKHTNTRTTIVVELDHSIDTVTCRDSVGYLWEFYGIEDWCVGDGCTLLLYDNATESILDDVILKTTYFDLEGLVAQ